MPQYTPNYGIPYPVNGDPIYLGAQQMAALANKVDALLAGHSGIPDPDPDPDPVPDPTPAAPKAVGILRWGEGWFNPPTNAFTRLQTSRFGRLTIWKNIGSVAFTDQDAPRLIAPVAGTYLLSVAQTWGNGAAVKGAGLTANRYDGAKNVYLWVDNNDYAFATASVVRWLPQGTTLYPWTWSGGDLTGMSPSDRDNSSEYSLVLLAADED